MRGQDNGSHQIKGKVARRKRQMAVENGDFDGLAAAAAVSVEVQSTSVRIVDDEVVSVAGMLADMEIVGPEIVDAERVRKLLEGMPILSMPGAKSRIVSALESSLGRASQKVSAPLPPLSVSAAVSVPLAKSPPKILSLPLPPRITSLPAPPKIRSLPALPIIRSRPPSPVRPTSIVWAGTPRRRCDRCRPRPRWRWCHACPCASPSRWLTGLRL